MTDHAPRSDRVSRARAFALAAHADQRYGAHPYAYHLDAVAHLLESCGPDAQVIGYLHDVVEDTPVPLDRIRAEFGDMIADCVALVTDSPGPNRAARKALTNAKLSKIDPAGPTRLALIVKAADRLANLRESAKGGSGSKLGMYRREHPAFREAAFRAGVCDGLWEQIEGVIASADVTDQIAKIVSEYEQGQVTRGTTVATVIEYAGRSSAGLVIAALTTDILELVAQDEFVQNPPASADQIVVLEMVYESSRPSAEVQEQRNQMRRAWAFRGAWALHRALCNPSPP